MKNIKKLLIASLLSLTLGACSNVINFDPSGNKDVDTNVLSANFDIDAIELEVGQEFLLNLEVTLKEEKEYSVEWRSSNKKVAQVSNGLVTAIRQGNATITAIVGLKVAVCRVVVKGEEAPFVEDITYLALTKQAISLKPGATEQLVYETVPSNVTTTVSFVSSNTSIATVDANGLVTALSEGTTTITARHKDLESSCVVTVSENSSISDFSMSISQQVATVLLGNTLKLDVTTSAPATVSWRSVNNNVASVDTTGLVTTLSAGTTKIIAAANNIEVSCNLTVVGSDTPVGEPDVTIYFFIDFNNVDIDDTTGTKLISKIDWYSEKPIREDLIPANPSVAPDKAFPNFLGWSTHTIIDDPNDLWDFAKDVVPYGTYVLRLYGIWTD